MRMGMRLAKTKGIHGYLPEMTELYAIDVFDPLRGSPFTSAMRQGLSLYRLQTKAKVTPLFAPFIYKKRTFYQDRLGTNIGKALKNRTVFAQVDPDAMPSNRVKKTHVLSKIKKQHSHGKEIRGRQITNLMNLFGAYRPRADQVFGETVKRVSNLVLADEWMVIEPDEKRSDRCRKRICCDAVFILKRIALPRQARDKHRDSTQKRELMHF
jgi:hypothetical protein